MTVGENLLVAVVKKAMNNLQSCSECLVNMLQSIFNNGLTVEMQRIIIICSLRFFHCTHSNNSRHSHGSFHRTN